MISTVEAVAELAAIGFDLPKDSFTNLMKLVSRSVYLIYLFIIERCINDIQY